MSKPYTVYAYPFNANLVKAFIVAHYGGIADQIDYPEFKMGVDNKSDHFIQNVNPTGQVPAVKTPEGYLFESNAIALYFAKKVGKGLLGNSEFDLAQIQQWIEFVNNWVKTPLSTWYAPYNGWALFDATKEQEAKDSLKGPKGRDPLGILNRLLGKHKFIISDSVTLADIVIWVSLNRLFTQVGTPDFLADVPNLLRWAKECGSFPEFKAGNYNRELVLVTKAPELPVKQ